MDSDRPRSIVLVTVWELLLYTAAIGTSGVLASFYVSPLLALDRAGAAAPISAVITHLAAANVHLLAFGGVMSLRGRRRRLASSRLLIRVLVLGALAVGVLTAIGVSRAHPDTTAIEWIILGGYAAVGPVFIGGVLQTLQRHQADRADSGVPETTTTVLGNADAVH